MKVLLANTGVFPVPPERGGGTEQYVYYLANSLAKLGHRICLISDVVRGCYLHNNVKISEAHSPPPILSTGFCGQMINQTLGGLSVFRSAFLELIRGNSTFDVVHTHGRLGATLLSVLKLGIPFVYTLHDSSPWSSFCHSSIEQAARKAAYSNLEMRTCERADHVAVVSQAMRNELVSRFGIDERKVSFIPSGVDTRTFKPRDPEEIGAEDIGKKYGFAGKYCIYVGQLLPRKGVVHLVEAFKGVKADIKCVIVGEGPDKAKLCELVNNLDLRRKIRFVGAVPLGDLVKLYASASFFVLPSLSEGLPLVVVEAQSCGLPVIASEVGGIPEVIMDGYNGFLVKPQDIDRMRDLIELLSEDEKLCRRISSRASKFALENFSWDKVAEKYGRIYKNLVNSN